MLKVSLYLLLTVILTSTLFSGVPAIPPKSKNLTEAITASSLVILGKPTKHSVKYFNDGKELTEEQARDFLLNYIPEGDEAYPRLIAKFHVSFETSRILKGASTKLPIEFSWSDQAGSMCPHINHSASDSEGVWYTGEHVKVREHDHKVYWTPIHTLNTVKAALK